MGRLWSHADFLKLWAGQSFSEFGSQVSVLAIPWLAAVGLHVNPIEFSLLEVLSFLPFILFALPAGVWVDRLRRRPILIASDSARAILLMLIPILWVAGALRIWNLLALQFLIAAFILYAVRSLHLSAIELGAIFAVGSAGAVCGALLANRIQVSIGIGPTIVSSAVLLSTGSLAFPLAPRSSPIPVLMFGYGLLS